jgi:hypothetical protein
LSKTGDLLGPRDGSLSLLDGIPLVLLFCALFGCAHIT